MSVPIDSRQLRAFAVLARTGSFTVAAKELCLSQSAVSHSMKALQEDVGCRLFDRMGKSVALTLAGEQLLESTERILSEMNAARRSLKALGEWGRSRLRLGASTTSCQYILPSALRQLKEKFPQCIISIMPGDTKNSVERLMNRQIDLALSLEPRNEPQLEFRPLFEDELMFITSPLHKWAKEGKVTRADIPMQQCILYEKGSYTFRMVEEYFKGEEMVLNAAMELGSMDAIKEMVKLGLGVSILAPWIARKELREGSLVCLPLGKRKLKRRWGIVHWRTRRFSLAEETLVDLCKEICNTPFTNGTVLNE